MQSADGLETFVVKHAGVEVHFGPGALRGVRGVLGRLQKPLIVTGSSSASKSGALSEVLGVLEAGGVEYALFDKARPNPTLELADELAKAFIELGARELVAIGGGSTIDLAKAARAIAAGGGRAMDYFYGKSSPPSQLPLLVVVNLTHGTGSEVNRFAVLTDEAEAEKRGFAAGYPNYSIDDPRYTLTLPRSQTLYTSIDALAHAIEAATSRATSPFVRLLAFEAARRIFEFLPRALESGGDLEARYWLLYASMLSGMAIDLALTHIGHGVEHILSAANPALPHGAGLAIVYRALIKHLYKARPETMCELLKPLNRELKPTPDDSERAQSTFNAFLDSLGFAETLSDYGFSKGDFVRLAARLLTRKSMARYAELAPVDIREPFIYELASELFG